MFRCVSIDLFCIYVDSDICNICHLLYTYTTDYQYYYFSDMTSIPLPPYFTLFHDFSVVET